MNEVLLECPEIYVDTKMIGYGGDQEWFDDEWARKAGCASVSATNTWIYYTIDQSRFEKEEYLRYMKEMYEVMKPTKRGFPYVLLYAKRLKEFLANQQINLEYEIIRKPRVDEATKIIKESIKNKHPIGLLILTHRRRVLKDDLWHWVTIFGYEETDKDINVIFTDCGKKKSIPMGILFERHFCNVVKMVKFYK